MLSVKLEKAGNGEDGGGRQDDAEVGWKESPRIAAMGMVFFCYESHDVYTCVFAATVAAKKLLNYYKPITN